MGQGDTLETSRTYGWSEIVESVIIALVLALLIRSFIFTPFYIPSRSMEPTLRPNDRIIVSRMAYLFGHPSRGDVVVFKYPLDPDTDYIKRIVAVGEETLQIKDNTLYINGEPVEEPYLPKGVVLADYGPVKVPSGSVFVMGDNRNSSKDSRYWGALPVENIIGKAVLVFWPPKRIQLIR